MCVQFFRRGAFSFCYARALANGSVAKKYALWSPQNIFLYICRALSSRPFILLQNTKNAPRSRSAAPNWPNAQRWKKTPPQRAFSLSFIICREWVSESTDCRHYAIRAKVQVVRIKKAFCRQLFACMFHRENTIQCVTRESKMAIGKWWSLQI